MDYKQCRARTVLPISRTSFRRKKGKLEEELYSRGIDVIFFILSFTVRSISSRELVLGEVLRQSKLHILAGWPYDYS